MGETSVNEGDTLELYCNVSLSNPPATVHWLSSNGNISDGGILEIANITGSWMGLYFCIASFKNFSITKNSSVEVVIQCKCMKCRYSRELTCACACVDAAAYTPSWVRATPTCVCRERSVMQQSGNG